MKHFDNCSDPAQIAIVGDRIPTDIVMGNQFGCFTILVQPLDPASDNFVVRTIRKFEDKLLPRVMPKAPDHKYVKVNDGLEKKQ